MAGDNDAATACYEKALAIMGRQAYVLSVMVYAQVAAGRLSEARELKDELAALASSSYGNYYFLATHLLGCQLRWSSGGETSAGNTLSSRWAGRAHCRGPETSRRARGHETSSAVMRTKHDRGSTGGRPAREKFDDGITQSLEHGGGNSIHGHFRSKTKYPRTPDSPSSRTIEKIFRSTTRQSGKTCAMSSSAACAGEAECFSRQVPVGTSPC